MNRYIYYVVIATTAMTLGTTACETPVSPEPVTLESAESQSRGFHEKPFRARLFTDLEALAPDPRCGDPPRFLNTQIGEGRAAIWGRFTTIITFCVDATDLLDDGQLTEGESVPYDSGSGVLVFDYGDELWVELEGVVLPSTHPRFLFEFHDAITFVGGTGRLAGVSGHGRVDSRVNGEDRTFHRWRGKLEFPRVD